jgi:wyosine [tRNA(Phe)-imidazoG37] synthetase (radical SAM superfamily)
MNNNFKYLFGPVPSRRLGLSLGVDITPHKTCSFDCIFCQVGRTTCLTIERKEYVPLNDVKEELKEWKKANNKADFITLSGAGEPTLHLRFGELLEFIEEELKMPSVLLSNGSMFYLPEVRQSALPATIVKLSLSAWDNESFRLINRPHPALEFQKIINGYQRFRELYKGILWLEVFLVPDLNTQIQAVKKIAEIASSIAPDNIHLNTAIRPCAETNVRQVPQAEMEKLAEVFSPTAVVISSFQSRLVKNPKIDKNAILNILSRHPCTLAQLATIFNLPAESILEYFKPLLATEEIKAHKSGNETYYVTNYEKMNK